MPHLPLEDNFTDVIAKAQRGWKISDEELTSRAGVSLEELAAVRAGHPIVAVLRRLARHLRLSPDALEALALNTWQPRPVTFPRSFAMFNTPYEGGITVNSYLVWDGRTRVAAAFDTGTDCADMLDLIKDAKLQLHYIFVTHTHEDHIADLPRLARTTGAGVWSHELEPIDYPGARTFKENAHFHIGEVAIKTLLTSGHSPGLTTYYVTGLSWPLAVVGDSIFASSIGGSAEHFEEQYKNDRTKIFRLPKDTVLAPGHGPLTTLTEERRHNPFFARQEPFASADATVVTPPPALAATPPLTPTPDPLSEEPN